MTAAHEPWAASDVPRTAILVSHYPLWLEALASVLMALDIDIVGETALPTGLLELLRQNDADVLLIDVDTPTGDADVVPLIDAAAALRPDLRVVVIGGRDDPEVVDAVLAAGAAAFVVKTASASELRSAVRQVFSTSIYLPQGAREVERPAEPLASAVGAQVEILTRREMEILRLAAEGHSNAELARRLWVTEQTIKFHLSNIYRKLDVGNRTEATSWAAAHGLLSVEADSGSA